MVVYWFQLKEFTEWMDFSFFKKILFLQVKIDKLANQKYYFIFVYSNGNPLEKVSQIFKQNNIEVSIDEIYGLNEVNKSLKSWQWESEGKTLIKI